MRLQKMALALTRHLTQQEIAERCGTTQPTISAIVRGARTDTSYAIGKKLESLHDKLIVRRGAGGRK